MTRSARRRRANLAIDRNASCESSDNNGDEADVDSDSGYYRCDRVTGTLWASAGLSNMLHFYISIAKCKILSINKRNETLNFKLIWKFRITFLYRVVILSVVLNTQPARPFGAASVAVLDFQLPVFDNIWLPLTFLMFKLQEVREDFSLPVPCNTRCVRWPCKFVKFCVPGTVIWLLPTENCIYPSTRDRSCLLRTCGREGIVWIFEYIIPWCVATRGCSKITYIFQIFATIW